MAVVPANHEVVAALSRGFIPRQSISLDLNVVIACRCIWDDPTNLIGRVGLVLLAMSLTEHISLYGRVHFLILIGRIDVVEYHIGVDTDLGRLVHGTDHRLQFGTTTKTRFCGTFLIVVTQVVMVVDTITVVSDPPVAFRGHWCPDGGDAT